MVLDGGVVKGICAVAWGVEAWSLEATWSVVENPESMTPNCMEASQEAGLATLGTGSGGTAR